MCKKISLSKKGVKPFQLSSTITSQHVVLGKTLYWTESKWIDTKPYPPQQEKAECASCARPERCTSAQEIVTLCASPSSVQESAQEIVKLCASPSSVQKSAQEIPVVCNLETLGNYPFSCCALLQLESLDSMHGCFEYLAFVANM